MQQNSIEKRIQEALTVGNRRLDLSNMGLTVLPIQILDFKGLTILLLDDNKLTHLPDLAQLVDLKLLSLNGNLLEELPSSISALKNLQSLRLNHNRLRALPKGMGKLRNLLRLELDNNKLTHIEPVVHLTNLLGLTLNHNNLTSLPEALPGLGVLTKLNARGNHLDTLPAGFNEFKSLMQLDISGNEFTDFPKSITGLGRLQRLNIKGNQIDFLPRSFGNLNQLKIFSHDQLVFPPKVVTAQGLKNIMDFLQEQMSERSEAKLMILGDGEEGKTCLSRALRGLEFETQDTTRGIEVEPWVFNHPDNSNDKSKEITLKIWDFEGQEINHQTHQFFLTTRSLYIIVFRGRKHIKEDRLYYWLDNVKHRAPECKVLLVATETEGREPDFDDDKFAVEYPQQLGENSYFAVDSKTGKNIERLRTRIAKLASELELVPQDWPNSYTEAERFITEASQNNAWVPLEEVNQVFTQSGIAPNHQDSLTNVFGDMGVFTHFPNSNNDKLSNKVVLRPQWLTKAISLVLESDTLKDNLGEVSYQWLRKQWEREYPGLHSFFYACMQEFELCYPLEDDTATSMVPLRFPYRRPPTIPWTQNPTPVKEPWFTALTEATCPPGLMSRFIVKTHQLIFKSQNSPKGIYWRNGVFLENSGPILWTQALCELIPDKRMIEVTIQAAYPENFMEALDLYWKAVFTFFPGLEVHHQYGCMHEDGRWCKAYHTAKSVKANLKRKRALVCEEDHEIQPLKLMKGLHVFSSEDTFHEVRPTLKLEGEDFSIISLDQRLARLENMLEKMIHNTDVLPQLSQMFQQSNRQLVHLLTEDAEIPNRFSLSPVAGNPWNPNFTHEKFRLRFFCDHEAMPHAWTWLGELEQPRKWWAKTGPYFMPMVKLLSLAISPAFAAIPLVDGINYDDIKREIKFTEKTLKAMPDWYKDAETTRLIMDGIEHGDDDYKLAHAALAEILKDKHPVEYRARDWGNLRRYHGADNQWQWLCPIHKPH